MNTCDRSIENARVKVRVRYHECDPMGVVHHSVYPIWFELARTELLRCQGSAYKDLEAEGVHFVVARLNMRFRRPARYDDVLVVRAEVAGHYANSRSGKTLNHHYSIIRGEELLASAESTLVCVDGGGKPRRMPEYLDHNQT